MKVTFYVKWGVQKDEKTVEAEGWEEMDDEEKDKAVFDWAAEHLSYYYKEHSEEK